MLKLTTLPIPNQPGVMASREIEPSEAIEIIRKHFRAGDCVSHIAYEETNRLVELRLGGMLKLGPRYMTPCNPGDAVITVRLRRGVNTPGSVEDFTFLLTEFMQDKMVKRLKENPGMLDEIARRLENDDIVDLEGQKPE